MDHGTKETSCSRVHVLDRINAKTIKIGEGNPILIHLTQISERLRCDIIIHAAHTLMHVLEVKEVALPKFRIIIEVGDAALLRIVARILKLDRPDCPIHIWKTGWMGWVGSSERYRR